MERKTFYNIPDYFNHFGPFCFEYDSKKQYRFATSIEQTKGSNKSEW